MVITGAGPGIMEAGIEGAGAERSFGVNIVLPFETSAAPVIAGDPKLINYRYFFTRKLTFVKESHAFACCPGGFGTMDEAFELLTLMQTGRSPVAPVVLLDPEGRTYWESWHEFVERELGDRRPHLDADLALLRHLLDRRRGGRRDLPLLLDLPLVPVRRPPPGPAPEPPDRRRRAGGAQPRLRRHRRVAARSNGPTASAAEIDDDDVVDLPRLASPSTDELRPAAPADRPAQRRRLTTSAVRRGDRSVERVVGLAQDVGRLLDGAAALG